MSTIDVLVNLGGAGNVQNMTTITIVDPDYFYGVTDGLDQMWILVTSYLVFFMQVRNQIRRIKTAHLVAQPHKGGTAAMKIA